MEFDWRDEDPKNCSTCIYGGYMWRCSNKERKEDYMRHKLFGNCPSWEEIPKSSNT